MAEICVNAKAPESPLEKYPVAESYNLKAKRQHEMEMGFAKFNVDPNVGIDWLSERGHLDARDAHLVAQFLRTHCDRLSKTSIGIYLGREPSFREGFNMSVLHSYVDDLDFREMRFDDALRFFLSGFRLPGEAQKIDRMMEKFSERYCLQNPDVFPNPDSAFILAFSIIMLNTDLHNIAIKDDKKMSKQAFLSNNKGICNGQDLSEDLLGEIFDRIKATPISLREDEETKTRKTSVTTFSSSWRRSSTFMADQGAFQRETHDMLKVSQVCYVFPPQSSFSFLMLAMQSINVSDGTCFFCGMIG